MIETKIVRILNPTQVVLGAGSEQGVREGMTFVLYSLSDEIRDPETGESLGQLEIVKGRVRVTHVQQRFCTATTESRTVTRGPLDPLALLRKTETVYEQLKVEGAVAVETDLTVRVGDLARETTASVISSLLSNPT
jgi:hypothetical protein